MDWTRGCTIGHGSSATVSIAKSHPSGEVFAVKSAELSKSESLQTEQQILSTISCPQIVSYKGFNISTENNTVFYNLFLEYAPAGALSDKIRRQGGYLNEPTIRSYTWQILLGLEYLHSNGIAHCDVKSPNILVTENGANVKLADLGCAKRVKGGPSAGWSPIGGTPVYMSPEVARGEQQGIAADVWALGCTMIEMATGRGPWQDVSDPVSALYRIGFSGEVPAIPSSLSKKGRDFVAKCLMRDPSERWSASQLLKHEFFLNAPAYLISSPTTVLDHGMWEEEEFELEPIWDPTRKSSCSESARERIGRLCEGNVASCRGMPDWCCDEDNWINVRVVNESDINRIQIEFELQSDTVASQVTIRKQNSEHRTIDDDPTNVNTSRCCSSSRDINCDKYVLCGPLNLENKELRLFVQDIHQVLTILFSFYAFNSCEFDWHFPEINRRKTKFN